MTNPRVWTLRLKLTNTLIKEVSLQLSDPLSEHKQMTDKLPRSFRTPSGATPEGLQKLVIEEHPTKVRVHLWLISDAEAARYDWFDIPISPGRYWEFDNGGGKQLWAYAMDAMVGGALSLSGSWEWDSAKKRAFFQLTFWVVRNTKETRQIPPADIIFKIPLEPGRLCDEQGRMVRDVGGEKRKAGEVEPFPYDEQNWEYKCGEGSEWRCSWYLHMQTFNVGFSNRGMPGPA